MARSRMYNHAEAIKFYVVHEWPTTEIAAFFGVGHSSIRSMLLRNGIQMRIVGRRKGVKYHER